jgi:hypothetical protein
MVAVLQWYPTDPKSGANLQGTQTVVNSQGSGATALSAITGQTGYELPAASFALGERLQGNGDSIWVFVKASTTVTAGNVVAIDEQYNANNMTITLGASLRFGVGIAQFYTQGLGPGSIQATANQATAQPGDFFWAAQQGQGLSVNISTTGAANGQLFVSSATPGSVTTTASGVPVKGLFVGTTAFTTGATGNQSTVDVSAIFPIYATA